MGQLLVMVAILVVIYFIMLRPQLKQQKEHQAMIANLKNGDTIITTGGIVGKIHNIDNNNIIIDTSSTKITISRSYVSQLVKKDKNKDKQK